MSGTHDLARSLGAALRARGWLCATAESCTAGLVAGAITSVAGSSEWFDRGFVTYSNEAKTELLGVSGATLAEHGAVSEATARAMATGALARSRAQIAVAVTGIAGPGGGVPGKPVGTVCFAWAARGDEARATTHHLAGGRAAVRRAAVVVALEGLVALARR
ncbi:MAG TPA: CinA family protein [Casimicrobiaceae bacterium]